MTQILVSKHKKSYSQPLSLVGTEAKNPVPTRRESNWEDIRGLTWVFYEDGLI